MPTAPRKKPTRAVYDSKKARFIGLGGDRVNSVLHGLKLVGQCSDPQSYEYTPAQIDAIFKSIRKGVDEAEHRFKNPNQKKVEGGLDLSKL